MITLFEKFNWWKKEKIIDEIDTPKYSLEESLNNFINELDKKLTNLEFQRSVCRFINDKLVNKPNVTFNAVKVKVKTSFQYELCISNKIWYDEHKIEYTYKYDAKLNPMVKNMYLLTLTDYYGDRIGKWNILSFLIHMDDLKNMLVDREIKYNRVVSNEDPLGEEDWND